MQLDLTVRLMIFLTSSSVHCHNVIVSLAFANAISKAISRNIFNEQFPFQFSMKSFSSKSF